MQISGDPADKYKFRTSPLRNIALAPAFFHNGAFARLEDAIRFHLDPTQTIQPGRGRHRSRTSRAEWDRASTSRISHPMFRNGGIELSESQIRDVTQFVKTGLLDPRAKKENLCEPGSEVGAQRARGADVRGDAQKQARQRLGIRTGDRHFRPQSPNPNVPIPNP